MLAVVCLWVIFRAPTWAVAVEVLKAMTFKGSSTGLRALNDIRAYGPAWALTMALGAAALALPNSRQVARTLRQHRLYWVPALVTGATLYFAAASIGTTESKFIYFNF
jgi:hypothetical protein